MLIGDHDEGFEGGVVRTVRHGSSAMISGIEYQLHTQLIDGVPPGPRKNIGHAVTNCSMQVPFLLQANGIS